MGELIGYAIILITILIAVGLVFTAISWLIEKIGTFFRSPSKQPQSKSASTTKKYTPPNIPTAEFRVVEQPTTPSLFQDYGPNIHQKPVFRPKRRTNSGSFLKTR